jgi:hypothetical protein
MLTAGSPDAALSVRAIAPPSGWSPIVPMSLASGEPLHARDRRPAHRRHDRAAVTLIAALTATAGGLALLLAL